MRYAGLGILGFIGLLILTIIGGSWYTIDQTERGVLLRNAFEQKYTIFVGAMCAPAFFYLLIRWIRQ